MNFLSKVLFFLVINSISICFDLPVNELLGPLEYFSVYYSYNVLTHTSSQFETIYCTLAILLYLSQQS